MKIKRTYEHYTKITLKPEQQICELCGRKLDYRTWLVNKYVVTLTGVLHIRSNAMKCNNPECLNCINKVSYSSNETHKYSLPKSTFGLDIVAYIGFKRMKESRNFDEIYQDLIEKEIQISRRNIDYLFQSFEYLIKCSLPSRLKELAPVFEKNGGIIISVDGLQPQQGNDLLYVLRDVETQEVLHGVVLHNTDTEAMVELFQIIKDSGIPVKGIVSDGQHSIRKAKDLVFPGVPYQLCTFHYLKDMGKVVGEKDRAIRAGFKKTLRIETD